MSKTAAEQIDVELKRIDKELKTRKFKRGLSNTSIRKFDVLTPLIAGSFGLAPEDVYVKSAVSRASNALNRFAEGQAQKKHFKLGVAVVDKGAASSAVAPASQFIGSGASKYDAIAIMEEVDGAWVVSHVVSNKFNGLADKIKQLYPLAKINIGSSDENRVVSTRAEVFVDLEKKFLSWLPKHDVKRAQGKYVRNLKAIGLSTIKKPKKSGKWDGLYLYLTGAAPAKGVYEVSGLEDFRRTYSKIFPLFEQDSNSKNPGEFDPQKYDECFSFLHAPVKSAVKVKDNQSTKRAFYKYLEFLQSLESGVKTDLAKRIEDVAGAMKDAGLTYTDYLCRRFISALLAKPFVILTGLSGSGKTKLAEAFARWLCGRADVAGNWKLVSVGADWTNSEKLLGYPDALHEGQYIMPDTGVLQFLMKAKEDESKDIPYFLILDEMNLSHVERYFADFLSAMESVDRIVRLHDVDEVEKKGVPKILALPRNLFVIGTMNVDETTYMFSPKVLDRAQVIEFRVDESAMLGYLDGSDKVDLDKLCDETGKGLGASYAAAFVHASKKDYPAVAEAKDTLAKFFPILSKLGAEFGFRTASEFRRFASIYVAAGGTPEDAVDFSIMQKLLPKLHGSKRKLSASLKALWNLCQKDPEKPADMPSVEKEDEFDFDAECRYLVSAKKILRMVRALDVGFASFAEA